jgi:EamA domain-containing membrane protein RarD
MPRSTSDGEIIVDAIIRANALLRAEVDEGANSCTFIWQANAAEQIEAALNELGYKLTPIFKFKE